MHDIVCSVLTCNSIIFDMITVRTSSKYSSQWQYFSGRKKTLKSTSQTSILRDPFGASSRHIFSFKSHFPTSFPFFLLSDPMPSLSPPPRPLPSLFPFSPTSLPPSLPSYFPFYLPVFQSIITGLSSLLNLPFH